MKILKANNVKGGLLVLALVSLAGCSSPASRMADCQAQGVSKDACYMVEQNRQSGINAAAEKQALENAAKYGQKAQAAHRHLPKGCTQVQDANGTCSTATDTAPAVKKTPFVKHVGKVEIKRDNSGLVSINGKPAAEIENEGGNTSYEAGIYIVTIYKSGKVALMKDRVFVDFAK